MPADVIEQMSQKCANTARTPTVVPCQQNEPDADKLDLAEHLQSQIDKKKKEIEMKHNIQQFNDKVSQNVWKRKLAR